VRVTNASISVGHVSSLRLSQVVDLEFTDYIWFLSVFCNFFYLQRRNINSVLYFYVAKIGTFVNKD
jgi:hypothetical protein